MRARSLREMRRDARTRAQGPAHRRHLEDNDAHPLFDRLGDQLRTGPANTNAMDLRLVLASRSRWA